MDQNVNVESVAKPIPEYTSIISLLGLLEVLGKVRPKTPI
ncbi:hypothetical protein RintRC_2183 [Richelia intracellularis]|nr:hypothetical protein RintRC_2183 [Richelia intracellularis]